MVGGRGGRGRGGGRRLEVSGGRATSQMGIIDLNRFIPLSVTLTMVGGHKVSTKQNLLAIFRLYQRDSLHLDLWVLFDTVLQSVEIRELAGEIKYYF